MKSNSILRNSINLIKGRKTEVKRTKNKYNIKKHKNLSNLISNEISQSPLSTSTKRKSKLKRSPKSTNKSNHEGKELIVTKNSS